MKRNLFLLILAVSILASSCTPKVKVVENPIFEQILTRNIDISRIEISDSATLVTVDVTYYPNYWITFSKNTHIEVEGQEFVATAIEGTEFDKRFWMPESGEASFKLTFPPISKKAKSMNFFVGSENSDWKIYDIDLTGRKKEITKWHPELPEELRKEINDMEIPEPILEQGRTKLRIHLMGFKEGMDRTIELKASSMASVNDDKKVTYDPEKGYAETELLLFGSTRYNFFNRNVNGDFWVAPNDDMDIYIDCRGFTKTIYGRRAGRDEYLPASVYTTGIYSDYNNATSNRRGLISIPPYEIKKEFNYKMSAEDYLAKIREIRKFYLDSLDRRTDLRPINKKINKLMIDLNYCELAMQAEGNLTTAFKREHKDISWSDIAKHYTPPTFTADFYKDALQDIDFNDKSYLMTQLNPIYSFNRNLRLLDLSDGNVYKEQNLYDWDLLRKAQALTITAEEMEQARKFKNQLFYEALQYHYIETQREYAQAQGKAKIEHTPNVADDKLLETIIAPHKGKVVVVDFWFVGCSGCYLDFKYYAPLKKKSELKDVVWIYVDCESALVPYTTRIADLDGIHYRFTREQWDAVSKKYGFDFAPAYFFVEKDGSFRRREDLRQPDKLESALKEMLKR